MHPDIRKYTLNAKRTATTVEGLERQLMSPPVVATTCLSTDQYVSHIFHPTRLLSSKKNNYCSLNPVHYFRAECSIIAL